MQFLSSLLFIGPLTRILDQLFVLLGNFSCFFLLIFFKINFFRYSFRNTARVLISLDPDQAQHFVGPDLGPNCLQRLHISGDMRGSRKFCHRGSNFDNFFLFDEGREDPISKYHYMYMY